MSAPAQERLSLCLYIAGDWPISQRALNNLRAILVGRDAEIEVVDVLLDPERGMRDGVYVTPTLIRLSPAPRSNILGDLSNRANVLEALGESAAL